MYRNARNEPRVEFPFFLPFILWSVSRPFCHFWRAQCPFFSSLFDECDQNQTNQWIDACFQFVWRISNSLASKSMFHFIVNICFFFSFIHFVFILLDSFRQPISNPAVRIRVNHIRFAKIMLLFFFSLLFKRPHDSDHANRFCYLAAFFFLRLNKMPSKQMIYELRFHNRCVRWEQPGSRVSYTKHWRTRNSSVAPSSLRFHSNIFIIFAFWFCKCSHSGRWLHSATLIIKSSRAPFVVCTRGTLRQIAVVCYSIFRVYFCTFVRSIGQIRVWCDYYYYYYSFRKQIWVMIKMLIWLFRLVWWFCRGQRSRTE